MVTEVVRKFGIPVAVGIIIGGIAVFTGIHLVPEKTKDTSGAKTTHGKAPPVLSSDPPQKWSEHALFEKNDLSSTGVNPYFILQPGYQLTFEGKDKEDNMRLTKTVLNETKLIDGVETRVVEERETKNGKLYELARNYFALSKTNNTVFYFGEDVDWYDHDGTTVINHKGTWHAGLNGATAGVQMPGFVLVGERYYQEFGSKVAMDKAETISVTDSLNVPAGTFQNVVKVEETNDLEPGTKEYKFYAANVGLIKDVELALVNYGFIP